MRAVRVRTLMLVGLSAWIGACTDGGVPTESPEPTLTTAVIAFGRGEDALKPALEAEKARIAREGERSKATYDIMKVEWDKYLHGVYSIWVDPRLIVCDPLQYAADTKIIGPEGGDMSIGPHKLSIPKGALRGYVVITGEMPVSLQVSVKLSPHGITFLKSPELMLSYKHCYRPSNFVERVAYVDDSGRITEWPRSRDSAAGEVFAWITHFSRYAVAW